MGKQLFTNNAESSLLGTLPQGSTSMAVASGAGSAFPAITGSDYFYLTLYTKDGGGVEQNIEVVKVTERTGDTMTLERDVENITGQVGGFAYDGTAMTVYVQERITAGTMTNALQAGDIGVSVQAYDADLAWVAANLTAAGKALLDDADVAAQRTSLGLGNAATKNVGTGAGDVSAGDHGHTAAYEPLMTKATGYAKWSGSAWVFSNEAYSLASHNHSGAYQPVDADLDAIAALAGTSGMLRKTGAGAWTLDTAAYGDVTLTGVQTLTNKTLDDIKTASFAAQQVLATTSGAIAINWTLANAFYQTEPTGGITYTFTNPPGPCHLQLIIGSDGTSSPQAIVWPANVKHIGALWAGVANKIGVINFWFDGTNYIAQGANEV